MKSKKRVLLIDDHHLIRAGLRALLEDNERFTVVGEGEDGEQAVNLCLQCQPDVLVMDIAMKRLSGLEALPKVVARFPEIPVIILSMHASSDYLQRAFSSGARGYLLKDSAEVELELALNSVLQGQRYISPKLSDDVLNRIDNAETKGQHEAPSLTALTARQQEILQFIALGRGTKEIAYELELSVKTVESHRAQIMKRLQIRDVASLVRYAIKHGLISLDA